MPPLEEENEVVTAWSMASSYRESDTLSPFETHGRVSNCQMLIHETFENAPQIVRTPCLRHQRRFHTPSVALKVLRTPPPPYSALAIPEMPASK